MPIETSLGQLTPFRRRGHLFFFSLAKPACRQTGRQDAKKSNRSLHAYRNHDFESTWYIVLGTSYNLLLLDTYYLILNSPLPTP